MARKGVDYRAGLASPSAGVDYRQVVAEAQGRFGVDWRAALAELHGKSGVDMRQALAETAGSFGVDWRAAVADGMGHEVLADGGSIGLGAASAVGLANFLGGGVSSGLGAALASGSSVFTGAGASAGTGAASATGSSTISDPSFANVVFLWEAEGADGQNTGVTEAKNGRSLTINSGTAQISTTQKRLGSSSFFPGTGGMLTANNADYQLGNTSNSSKFCIEFSAFEGTLVTWEALQFWNGGEHSWWVRLQDNGEIRLLASADGSASFSIDFTTSGFGFTNNAWHDICINKDSSGKIRFFRNGVLKSSTTPANSVFFASTNSQLTIGSHGAINGYVDHMRLTKSDDRGIGDAGYTVAESAFLTS